MEDNRNKFDPTFLVFVLCICLFLIIVVFDVFGADDTNEPPLNIYGYTNLFGYSFYQPEDNQNTTQSGFRYLTFNPYYLDKSYICSNGKSLLVVIPSEIVLDDYPVSFGSVDYIYNHYRGDKWVFIQNQYNYVSVQSNYQNRTTIVDGVEYVYYSISVDSTHYQYSYQESFGNKDLSMPNGLESAIRYMVSNNLTYTQEFDSDIPHFTNLNVKFSFSAENVVTDENKQDTPVVASLLKSVTCTPEGSLLSNGLDFSYSDYDLECYINTQFTLYKETTWFFDTKREKLYSSIFKTGVRSFSGVVDVTFINEHFVQALKNNANLVSPMFESNYKANFNTVQFCVRLKKNGRYGKWYSLTYDYEKKTALAQILVPLGSSESTLVQDSGIKDVAGSATSNGGWQQGNSDFNTGTSVGGNPSNNGSGTGDINDIVDFIGNVPAVIGVVFSWLPSWVVVLIGTSIAIIVTFAVAKAFL